MGLSDQQRKETLDLIHSALSDGLGFKPNADLWFIAKVRQNGRSEARQEAPVGLQRTP